MLPRALVKDHDRRRLRTLLAVLFFALAVPTGVLIWQAYGQLKWEAFHQYRSQAEELTQRIDSRIAERIASAAARSFADYSFIKVSGDPAAGFIQRSMLSAYPVVAELPGIIGYFQVDADGLLSTPLLPGSGTDLEQSRPALGLQTLEEARSLCSLPVFLRRRIAVTRAPAVGRAQQRGHLFVLLRHGTLVTRAIEDAPRAMLPRCCGTAAQPAELVGRPQLAGSTAPIEFVSETFRSRTDPLSVSCPRTMTTTWRIDP